MLSGLPVALLLAAQAAAGPAEPPGQPAPAVKAADDGCSPQRPSSDREIVICAPKSQGYRIDPDVLAAKRAKKQALAGRPKPPSKMPDTSCTVVGPAGCIMTPGINLIAAAATAAEMAERLSKGEEIGSMFVTDPQPSEYQLYKEAKAKREAEEAEKAAKAKTKAAADLSAKTPGN
jgi:hypothetical protein